MTDEDGVEERYRPTENNLVRNFLQPHSESTHPNDAFLQKREIESLRRGVKSGDRRVFYCMSLPSRRSPSPTLILSHTISRRSFGPDTLQVG